jgi:hypothetical protein
MTRIFGVSGQSCVLQTERPIQANCPVVVDQIPPAGMASNDALPQIRAEHSDQSVAVWNARHLAQPPGISVEPPHAILIVAKRHTELLADIAPRSRRQ